MKTDKIKRSIVEALDLPKEVILDLPKIIMIGTHQLSIENHKGILEHTSDRIRINTKVGILRITGENLMIKNIIKEEIVIAGEINQVEFIN